MDLLETSEIIKAFGFVPKANFVPQSEEPVFILTASQLEDILTRALQPLHEEVLELRATIDRQSEKIAALEATATLQEENQLIQLRLIGQLREATKKEAQPMQKDRGEILRTLIAANGGKMLAKDARQKMHLSKNRFSELLKLCDFIETKPLHSDRRKDIIILKSELVPRN